LTRPGAGAKLRAGSSALIRTSIACPRRGADSQLLAHEIDAGDELRDRVLHLQARVQLDEVEALVGAEQKLERARVAVADRLRRMFDRGFHRLPRLGRDPWRRRFLDQLLVAPLNGALALPEGKHVAMRIGEHLDLHVPGRADELFDVEAGITESGLCLRGGGLEVSLEVGLAVDDPHSLAASASGSLEQDRVIQLGRKRARLGELDRA